jgi:hypothetical protein
MQGILFRQELIKLTVHTLIACENLRRAEQGKAPLTQQEIARGSGGSQPVISTLMSDKATQD